MYSTVHHTYRGIRSSQPVTLLSSAEQASKQEQDRSSWDGDGDGRRMSGRGGLLLLLLVAGLVWSGSITCDLMIPPRIGSAPAGLDLGCLSAIRVQVLVKALVFLI